MKNTIRNKAFALFTAFMLLISLPVQATTAGCNPENLAKLPEKKREFLEKKCAEKEAKKDFKISNECCIDKEPKPTDQYTGSDKSSLEKMIRDAWKKAYPEDVVLGIHFPSNNWKTEKKKIYNEAIGEVSYTDLSVLVANVVVKTDDDVATIFPAYINRNNLDDTLKPGVSTKASGYVIKQMLVKNYR